MATNDDWKEASNAAEIQATGLAPSNNLESALVIRLAPRQGLYRDRPSKTYPAAPRAFARAQDLI